MAPVPHVVSARARRAAAASAFAVLLALRLRSDATRAVRRLRPGP